MASLVRPTHTAMGVVKSATLRRHFARHLVPYKGDMTKLTHIVDAAGVLHRQIMSASSLAVAVKFAREFPEILRARMKSAGDIVIACDSAVPQVKKSERALRAKQHARFAELRGIHLAAAVTSPDELPATLRTPAIRAEIAAGAVVLRDLLDAHVLDADVAAVSHGGVWNAVLLPFAARKLIRVGIEAARAANMTVVEDPALSPEGEIGAVGYFARSASPGAVLVGTDTDVLISAMLQTDGTRPLFYRDQHIFSRTSEVYDIAGAIRTWGVDRSRRLAHMMLFLGCDYVHWSSLAGTQMPTPLRLCAALYGIKPQGNSTTTPTEAAEDDLFRSWPGEAVDVAKLRLAFGDRVAGQLARTAWAVAYYGGNTLDFRAHGWDDNGDPTP